MSARKIAIDGSLSKQFRAAVAGMEPDKPVFVPSGQRVFNSTVNNRLKRLCKNAGIPVITLHGLRHTHGSILFYSGVSIHSISRRLGHANISVTQNVYLHIIRELESRDNGKITDAMQQMTE